MKMWQGSNQHIAKYNVILLQLMLVVLRQPWLAVAGGSNYCPSHVHHLVCHKCSPQPIAAALPVHTDFAAPCPIPICPNCTQGV